MRPGPPDGVSIGRCDGQVHLRGRRSSLGDLGVDGFGFRNSGHPVGPVAPTASASSARAQASEPMTMFGSTTVTAVVLVAPEIPNDDVEDGAQQITSRVRSSTEPKDRPVVVRRVTGEQFVRRHDRGDFAAPSVQQPSGSAFDDGLVHLTMMNKLVGRVTGAEPCQPEAGDAASRRGAAGGRRAPSTSEDR